MNRNVKRNLIAFVIALGLCVAMVPTLAYADSAPDADSTTTIGYFQLKIYESVYRGEDPKLTDINGEKRFKLYNEEARWSAAIIHLRGENPDRHIKNIDTGFQFIDEPSIDYGDRLYLGSNAAIFYRSQQFGIWNDSTGKMQYKTDSRLHFSFEPHLTWLHPFGRVQVRLNAIGNTKGYVSTTAALISPLWIGQYYRPSIEGSYTWLSQNKAISLPKSTYSEALIRQGGDVLGGQLLLGNGCEAGLSYRVTRFDSNIWVTTGHGPGAYLRGSWKDGKAWAEIQVDKLKFKEQALNQWPRPASFNRNEMQIRLSIGFRIMERGR